MVDMKTIKQISKKLVFGAIIAFSFAFTTGFASTPVYAAACDNVPPDERAECLRQEKLKDGSEDQAEEGDLKCSVLPSAICNKAKEEATGGDISNTGVFELLKFVLRLMTAGVGIVAVGSMVYAGIMYASAGDSQQQVQKSKDMIKNIAIGILAYIGMFLILNWLIPGGVFG